MTYTKDNIVFEPKPTHPLFRDIVGQQFGRLTVLGYAGRKSSTCKKQMWFCECECATIKKVSQSALNTGLQSCGCVRDEKIGALNRTHGMANSHPLYTTWLNVRRRCRDTQYPKYASYGARGIKVCNRWFDSFEHFLIDMGNKPSPTHSIERKNNNAHYSCGHCKDCLENHWDANCEWGTPLIQGNNTRSNHLLTFNGQTQTIAQWARTIGLSYGCLITRVNRLGWSIEKSLTTPRKH